MSAKPAPVHVAKPVVPDDISLVASWVTEVVHPYVIHKGYGECLPLCKTPARAGVEDDQDADDHEDYSDICSPLPQGVAVGNADQKKASELYKKEVSGGNDIICDILSGTIYDEVCYYDGDKRRLSCLITRLLKTCALPEAERLTQFYSKLVPTSGMFSDLIEWPHHLNTRAQAQAYFSLVQSARRRHKEVDTDNSKPITDRDLTNRFTFSQRGILPARYTETWINEHVLPHVDNFAKCIQNLKSFDLARADAPGSGARGGSAFNVSVSSGSSTYEDLKAQRDKLSKLSSSDQKSSPCPHYHSEFGCGFPAASCKYSHSGQGKVNEKQLEKFMKRKSGAAGKPSGKAGGDHKRDRKLKEGRYDIKYDDRTGKPLFRTVNHVAGDDSDDEGEPAPKKKKHHTKKPGRGFFAASLSILGIATTLMAALATADAGHSSGLDPDDPTSGGFASDSGYDTDTEFSVHTIHGDYSVSAVADLPITDILQHPNSNWSAWIWDTGATVSIKRSRRGFNRDYRAVKGHPPVTVADGKKMKVIGKGSVTLRVRTSRGYRNITLRNVLHCEGCNVDILSRHHLEAEGFSWGKTGGELGLTSRDGVHIPFTEHRGLLYVTGEYNNDSTSVSLNSQSPDQLEGQVDRLVNTAGAAALWGKLEDTETYDSPKKRLAVRLGLAKLGTYTCARAENDELLKLHAWGGHHDFRKTTEYITDQYDDAGIKKKFGAVGLAFCKSCAAHKTVFADRPKGSNVRSTEFGAKTHSDIYGPFKDKQHGSSQRYLILFLDDATSYATVYAIDNLQKIPHAVETYFSWVQVILAEKGKRLSDRPELARSDARDLTSAGRLHTDSHSVYTSAAAKHVYANFNITWTGSAPGEHQRNGSAERYWRSSVPRAAAMCDAAGLPRSNFKVWANLHAATTHNIFRCRANVDGDSPEKRAYALTGHRHFKSDHTKIHTFGRTIFAKRLQRSNKDIPAAREGVYIGTNFDTGARRIWFPTTAEFKATYAESNHVAFERGLPLLPAVAAGAAPLEAPGYVEYFGAEEDAEAINIDNGDDDTIDLDYWAAQGNLPVQPPGANAIQIEVRDGGVCCSVIWSKEKAYNSDLGDHYRQSDCAELNQHIDRGVLRACRIDDLTPTQRSSLIETNMSRTVKYKDGVFDRCKSRLCANNKTSTETDIPLDQIRTVTPYYSSCRSLFCNAAMNGSTVYVYDYPNAFGQVPADKVRYVRSPRDLRQYDHGCEIVWECANLQGLQTAGRNYQNECTRFITKELGFVQSTADPATFHRPAGPPPPTNRKRGTRAQDAGSVNTTISAPAQLAAISMFVWIDDCVYETGDPATHRWLADRLAQRWDQEGAKAKAAKAEFVLGMKVIQKPGSISISSRARIERLATDFGMGDCYPKQTPMAAGAVVTKGDGDPLSAKQHQLFRKGVATILYLSTTTRPDVCFVAGQLGKVQSCPTNVHMNMLKRAIGYLLGTKQYGITYHYTPAEQRGKIEAYADAAFCDSKDDMRSTSGGVSLMGGGAISFHSRTMRTVALSTAEAEIMSATETAKDLAHLEMMCEGLGIRRPEATTLHEDNMAVLMMCSDLNHSVNTRSRHIAARHFYVRGRTQPGEDEDGNATPAALKMVHCRTEDMLADTLTKSLPKDTFLKHRERLVQLVDTDEPTANVVSGWDMLFLRRYFDPNTAFASIPAIDTV